MNQFTESDAELGLQLVPIKRRGLAASSGSTPFDVLFLALSMFVIGSALILVSLLFRLSIQQRAAEVGLLKATGFAPKRLRNLWLAEMSLVSLVGALIGLVLGVGYAALMIKGLTTWWVGAIARPFLTMHVSCCQPRDRPDQWNLGVCVNDRDLATPDKQTSRRSIASR